MPSAETALNIVPAVFTIGGERPFLKTLVDGIYRRLGEAPEALARATLLLPTRRAARALAEAFLQRSEGRPLLLPRMLAIGDIDAEEMLIGGGSDMAAALDIPMAISDSRRQLLLTQLVRQWGARPGRTGFLPAQAAALARELARLLDQVQAEGVSLDQLGNLVPSELAAHWEETHAFLDILRTLWPGLLEVEGTLDPSERLNLLVRAQAEAWRTKPPEHPVFAAGFAATSPATAELLTLVSLLPNGAVILPGVEQSTEEGLWAAIGDDPTHPQHGLHHLLARMSVAPDAMEEWVGAEPQSAADRTVLLREIMRPAAMTQSWSRLCHTDQQAHASELQAGLHNLTRIDCADPQHEALTIALALRQALEIPDATAILVTPDRALARRVAAELQRWQIDIDDSAGQPLNQTPPGVLLRLITDALAEDLAPIPLLALLKHPLAQLGYAPGRLRSLVRRLEISALRGPRPAAGLVGIESLARESKDEQIRILLHRLIDIMGPLCRSLATDRTPLDEVLTAHAATAELFAATDERVGAELLWSGEAGEATATLMEELIASSSGFGAIAGSDYPALFETLLAGRVVRPRFGRHARLQILGTLEARLQQADRIILGGLNEGIWPAATGHDPWMSRPMRQEFGLPPLESRIGLAAHDFVSALNAPEIILTRAVKSGGAPTVPSRWLLRLDTVLTAVDRTLELPPLYASWAAGLDAARFVTPCLPPEPRPPVDLRPTGLSATEIEVWRRDPYAIFAKHILKLRALDPIDADPGLADRGQIIHSALADFIAHHQELAGGAAQRALIDCGQRAFAAVLDRPGVWAFLWPRFERIADWFLGIEAKRRAEITESFAERAGEKPIATAGGIFRLRARADRIDRLTSGSLAIIDYKTGGLPTAKDVLSGYAPQLVLEALIAESGGFADLPAAKVTELAFWRLSGGDPAGETAAAGGSKADLEILIPEAYDGLVDLIEQFQDPATPYLSQPRSDRAPRYSDYAHLARVLEWGEAE